MKIYHVVKRGEKRMMTGDKDKGKRDGTGRKNVFTCNSILSDVRGTAILTGVA
jgi:hypothetical protein